MLRESNDHNGDDFDLQALTGGVDGAGSGIPHGDLLVAFAEAVTLSDDRTIAETRNALQAAMGNEAVVDAAGIIGMFNGLDRVADATGAPLEDWKAADTAQMRAAIGIDKFAAVKAEIEAGGI
jgi:hypothetical protein